MNNHEREQQLLGAKQALLQDPELSEQEAQLLREVSLTMHPDDGMYRDNARHYLRVGLSAIHCMDAALEVFAGQRASEDIRSILDMGCGYGRVLRFIRVRFPDARLVACEINPRAVAFCTEAFAASGVQSHESFDTVRLPGPFDLIWCGSVVTHLSAAATARLLRLFYRGLAVGGLCIFSTNGEYVLDRIVSGECTYRLTQQGQEEVRANYAAVGYGYAAYDQRKPDHGTSVESPQGVMDGTSVGSPQGVMALAHPNDHWRQVLFLEKGWDNNQDVLVWERTGGRESPLRRLTAPLIRWRRRTPTAG